MQSNLFIVTYKDGDIHIWRRKISFAALKLTEGIGTNYSQTNTKKTGLVKGDTRHRCRVLLLYFDEIQNIVLLFKTLLFC